MLSGYSIKTNKVRSGSGVKDQTTLYCFDAVFMSRKSILLIEPEASIGEVLPTCLREFGGWRVMLSSSIKEGVDLCMITHLDVILLDASTFETDALIFIEQLKQQSLARSIPILLITARASWFTLEQLHQMGFAGAIAKPFNPLTLCSQISHFLGWSDGEL